MLLFCDISDQGRPLWLPMAFSPHYRSTSRRSKRRRKRQSGILHTPCSLLSFPRFAPFCEVASLSLYGLFSSMAITSCGNLPLWHVPSFGGKVQHVAGMEGGIQKKRVENKKKLPGLLQVGQFRLLVAVVVFRQGSPASSAVHSLSVSLWFRCQSLILNEAVSGHFGGLFQSHDVED